MGAATKADLHTLVEQLPDDRLETAKRLLQRLGGEPSNFIQRFIATIADDEASLLDGLAGLDRELGSPPAESDADPVT